MTLFVVGGASGIGRAMVLEAPDGVAVAVGDLNLAGAERTAAVRRERGSPATAVDVDVTDRDSCARAVAIVSAMAHGLTQLVVSAGTLTGDGPVTEITGEAWESIIGVNLTGPANVVGAALPSMLERGGGAIVLLSSIAALRGRRSLAAYTASKAGVLGLVRSVAADFGSRGIRINAACLGPTSTPMTEGLGTRPPLNTAGRSAEPTEIARGLLWLVGPDASWINGAEIVMDQAETAIASGMVRH